MSPTQNVSLPADNKPADVCPVKKSTPYPSYLDQVSAYNEFPVQSQHALRAMELARNYQMDIIDIAKEINEPILWVRKVLIATIAFSVMNSDQLDDVSSVETMIGIGFDLARCIQGALTFQTILSPVFPGMEQWVKDNLSAKELDLILKVVSACKHDLPHLLKSATPPKKTNCIQIPYDAYTDQLQVSHLLLLEIGDHAKNKRFSADTVKKIAADLNKHTTAKNEIFDWFHEGRFL